MSKKKPLPIYLLDDLKNYIKEQAEKEGETMNSYIVSLIKKDQKRVERNK